MDLYSRKIIAWTLSNLTWYKAWEETGFTEKELERNPLNKLENIESTSIKEIFDSAKA